MQSWQIQTFPYEYLHLLLDAAPVNLNGIKTILANSLSTFFIKGNPFFSIGPKSLAKKPPNCLLILYQLINHLQKLYEALKLVYQLKIIYVENYSCHQNHQLHLIKVSKLLLYYSLFLILIYLLLSCELDNFTFKVLN